MPFNIATETISSFLEKQADDTRLHALLETALLRSLSRELTNQETPNNLHPLSALPENASDGLRTAFSKKGNGQLYAFEPDSDMRSDINHIVDWLKAAIHNNESWLSNCDEQGRPKKLLKIGSLEQATKEANKAMLRFSQKAAAQSYDDIAGERTVMTFADGYRIAQLLTPEALDRESAHVGHCIGDGKKYDNKLVSGSHVFYSLRDPKGKGHATMEVEVKNHNLMQCKGKENEPPISRYMPHIQAFLKREQFNLKESVHMTGLVQANGEYYDVHRLPENISIEGDFDLSRTDIASLPRNISVSGNITLFGNNQLTSLNSNISAGGNIYIRNNSSLTSISCDIWAEGNVYIRDNNSLISLNGHISIKENFRLDHNSSAISVPANISARGDATFSCRRLTSLTGDILVDGNLDLNYTAIRSEPKNILVKGKIQMPIVAFNSRIESKFYERDT